MQVPLTPAPSASAAVERIRKCLDETLIHLDNPDADLGSSPLISLDITASHTTGGNTTLESAETLLRDLDDVSQLLVNLALRYNEQVALLKTNHTSTVLKHQVESRRLNDRIAQDAKVASATSEALQNAKAENGLLQEQLRQEQLTSGAKIDVLHQKIVQLESTLHTAQQKLQQHQLSTVPTPASASPSPSENAPQTSDTPSLVASSDSATLSTGAESEKEATSLERDLRMATDLMRVERERAEKNEVDLRRAQADLERLKLHLIKVQDESDEKELEMREEIDRLSAEREAFVASGLNPAVPSDGTSASIEELQQMQGKLDSATIEIAELEEALEDSREREAVHANEIANLEASLVQLQADQHGELELHTVSLKNQVASLKEHIARVESQLVEEREKVKASFEAIAAANDAHQQVEEARALRDAIEYENDGLRAALKDAAARLSTATEGRDSLIAKPLVAKIFSTYLNPATTASSKAELLHLMANILEFSDDDRKPLGIPLIKPAEPGAVPATPARGLVSRMTSATGAALTGSITKSKQWLNWGWKSTQTDGNSQASSAETGNAPPPSLADMWVKILLEGSEATKSTAKEAAQAPTETNEPPAEAFKVPFLPPSIAPAPSLTPISTSSVPSASFTQPGSTAQVASAPHTPVPTQTFAPRFGPPTSSYAPSMRPEPSQSPYLAQQQAMRSSMMQNRGENQPTKPLG